MDDSRTCVAPRCVELGCFPTLREVIDAILEALKLILKVLGVILLIILIVLLGRWLRGAPMPRPAPVPIAAAGEATDTQGAGGVTDMESAEQPA